MKKIILVRHTEKQIIPNFSHVESDSSITMKGVEQAHEIKDFLKSTEYDVVFTSLLKRAIETAEIINEIHNRHVYKTNAFNEYLLRANGDNVEGTNMGVARSMTKLYSLSDQYDTILLVSHSSIGQTIIQSLLNLEWEVAQTYFNNYGDTYILRYDKSFGDNKWKVIDSFTPIQ